MHTLSLQVQEHSPLNTVLNEVDQDAREPAPVRELRCSAAEALTDESQSRQGVNIVCYAVHKVKQNGWWRVKECVKQWLLPWFLRGFFERERIFFMLCQD